MDKQNKYVSVPVNIYLDANSILNSKVDVSAEVLSSYSQTDYYYERISQDLLDVLSERYEANFDIEGVNDLLTAYNAEDYLDIREDTVSFDAYETSQADCLGSIAYSVDVFFDVDKFLSDVERIEVELSPEAQAIADAVKGTELELD